MVYDMPDDDKRRLAESKVESQFARAVAYAENLNARVVVPSAGPPCFLDPELFHLNKVTGNEITIFPHQPEFIERLAKINKPAILNMPGTTIDVTPNSIDVTHPIAENELHDIWANIGTYLAAYQADWQPWLAQHKATWHAPTDALLSEIQKWFRPLMAMCPTVSVGIGGNVLIQTTGHDDLGILLHFEYSDVQRYTNQPYRYRFEIQRELLETVVANKAVDWSNALFLSARFRAWRDGDFNENVYNFFKSLSSERMGRTEVEAYRKATETPAIAQDEVQVGDYIVGRFCPHRQADFGMFGVIEGEELVCTLHGWRFDLASGACRSSVGKSVKIRKRA
jgi:UDP-MurNAc hydroxylase